MKDQVVMSKTNGQLAIAVPLFRWHRSYELMAIPGYVISMTKGKPLAYILDCGPNVGEPQVYGARFCERNLEFLGDLEPDSFLKSGDE